MLKAPLCLSPVFEKTTIFIELTWPFGQKAIGHILRVSFYRLAILFHSFICQYLCQRHYLNFFRFIVSLDVKW